MGSRLRWAIVLIGTVAAQAAAADEVRVAISGNGTDVTELPLFVALEDSGFPPGSYELRPVDGRGSAIPAQVVDLGDRRALALIVPSLGARETVEYTMAPGAGTSAGVAIAPEVRDLRVSVRDELVTVYRANDGPKPYYYPVIGPGGVPMTRGYPMDEREGDDRDHPHQRSFWFTHGNVNGVDFWASDPLNRPNPKFGTIVETGRPAMAEGPVVGLIRTTNEWRAPEGEVLCTDDRVWRTYALGGSRVIDFDITISAGDAPVTFEDTKEGTFGLRLASSMNVNKKTGGRIVNAEGVTDLEAWGKASPWVDYSGPVGGRTMGVAILNHPESFRYPTTWHVRDYGLFAANPFGYRDFQYADNGSYTIPPGESIRLSYRVILHEGDTDQAAIAEAFQGYAAPPRVEVTRAE